MIFICFPFSVFNVVSQGMSGFIFAVLEVLLFLSFAYWFMKMLLPVFLWLGGLSQWVKQITSKQIIILMREGEL